MLASWEGKCVCLRLFNAFQWLLSCVYWVMSSKFWNAAGAFSAHVLNKVDKMLKMRLSCVILSFLSADAGGSEQTHWWSDGADQTPAGEAGQAERAHQDAAESGAETPHNANASAPHMKVTVVQVVILHRISAVSSLIPNFFQVQQARQKPAAPRSSDADGSVQSGGAEQRDSPVGK